ncbi:MAG: family 78 glycoside hydrolase catalytic domain [Chthonomonadetes bacterium]|nr:family 78 glycoside hydrolase catalytic domain [Chthonomonadetes bacterium]
MTNTFAMMIPIDLRCEYLSRPMGVDVPQPRLSWTLWSRERAQRQTAYRILVASSPDLLARDEGDLWDTGRVESDQTTHIPYTGKPLRSLQRCYWKVQAWDAQGNPSEWSEISWWEMGILHPEEWKAQWISAPQAEPAPLLRKAFLVSAPVRRARALVCGLGYYELWVNGARVGDHVLDPAQTDYEGRALYVVYDITHLLMPGENAVGIMLGNGWFHQAVVWGGMSYGLPCALLQMALEYEDGTAELICTDGSWKTFPGPVLKNNVYAGEEYDARLEVLGWSTASFDDSAWRPVQVIPSPTKRLQSQLMPPIQRIKTLQPISLWQVQPGVWVYDMGQNFAGWARLKVEAPEGTTITLRFAEELHPDGSIDPASTGVFATNVVQTDRYTCKGTGVEIWEPRFTYHGFRYVEMTGYPGTPTLDMLGGVVVHTAVQPAGTFECSDEMLNRIHRTALWTEVSNLHSVPTDCPHRERCGWLGDAHVSAEMTIYNFEMAPFWRKYLEDIETSLTENGLPTFVAPGKRKIGEASPDWGTAIVQIPYYLYVYYGDTTVLEKHYDTMKQWVEHLQESAQDMIVSAGLGDWCAPGSVPGNTPIPITSTAVFYLDARIMQRVAQVLGKTEDASVFEQLATQIREAFNRHFFNAEERSYGSQTADVLALAWGLVPEGMEQAVADSLARDVMKRHRGHHTTGIFGLRHLFWTLSEYGHGDVAMTILHQTDYPSIGYLFSLGATTLWEWWSEPEIEQQEGPRSCNHPMQGGFDAWFFYGIAGIRPCANTPGFRHFVLKPHILPGIEWARASYRSVRGLIRSEWRREGERLHWKVSVPPNTSATVYLPATEVNSVTENGKPLDEAEGVQVRGAERGFVVVNIGSGEYRFDVGMG